MAEIIAIGLLYGKPDLVCVLLYNGSLVTLGVHLHLCLKQVTGTNISLKSLFDFLKKYLYVTVCPSLYGKRVCAYIRLQVKGQVKHSLKEYKGLGSQDVISVAWNVFMIQVLTTLQYSLSVKYVMINMLNVK